MNNRDVKVGIKVVPFQKTVRGCVALRYSIAWGRAKKDNQPYVYVINWSKNKKCWRLGYDKDSLTGDFFNAEDFNDYVEEKDYELCLKFDDAVYGDLGTETCLKDINGETLHIGDVIKSGITNNTSIVCTKQGDIMGLWNATSSDIQYFQVKKVNSYTELQEGEIYYGCVEVIKKLKSPPSKTIGNSLENKPKTAYKISILSDTKGEGNSMSNKINTQKMKLITIGDKTIVSLGKKQGVAKRNPEDNNSNYIGACVALGRAMYGDKFNFDKYLKLEGENIVNSSNVQEIMSKQQFEDYCNNKFVINCETKYEANVLLNHLLSKGFRWCSGASILERNNWDTYEDETCYALNDSLGYGTCGYYNMKKVKIVKFKDLQNIRATSQGTDILDYKNYTTPISGKDAIAILLNQGKVYYKSSVCEFIYYLKGNRLMKYDIKTKEHGTSLTSLNCFNSCNKGFFKISPVHNEIDTKLLTVYSNEELIKELHNRLNN